jgi:hypothetical protein
MQRRQKTIREYYLGSSSSSDDDESDLGEARHAGGHTPGARGEGEAKDIDDESSSSSDEEDIASTDAAEGTQAPALACTRTIPPELKDFHILASLRGSVAYAHLRGKARLNCDVCGRRTRYYCMRCSDESMEYYVGVCRPGSSRRISLCWYEHSEPKLE